MQISTLRKYFTRFNIAERPLGSQDVKDGVTSRAINFTFRLSVSLPSN